MNFKLFKNAVSKQFERMKSARLLRTDVPKDELWDLYLASFPEGTNPIFRTRTEFDCNCCKQFVRTIGNVVAVVNGKLESIWDIKVDEPAFQAVADALAAKVRSGVIVDQFLHYEPKVGTDRSLEDRLDGVHAWEHFYVQLPAAYVKPGKDIPTLLNGHRTTAQVFGRALREISMDAVDTVLDLTAQKSLYRGDEHKATLLKFRQLKDEFEKSAMKDVFPWVKAPEVGGSVAGIRNTSIGTLLVDLSEGKELDDAVKAFEVMVAPANYKRPTALVTKAMVEEAKEKIAELGLTSALDRRYARLDDITINNVLFADRNTRSAMGVDPFDSLMTKGAKPKNLDKVEDVPIDRFIGEILPRAESIEVMFDNAHVANLVSLIAPVDPGAGLLFKWDNRFSWSYAGDFADAIKERVKAAGGNITGDVCCRLAWSNYDDLDFHMAEPDGHEIYFKNKGRLSPCGGVLDVDMNAGYGSTRTPVENIVYANKSKMKLGGYKLSVHQFAKRESTNVGFQVDIEVLGVKHTLVHAGAVAQNKRVDVATLTVGKEGQITVTPHLESTTASKTVWGIATQQFHKVRAVMHSPNYWDGQGVGNKHFFFMLEGCVREDQARGFYNEFLRSELDPHRKVIEMVGSKLKTETAAEQLSGLGFSSTARNKLLCRVSGSFNRLINITF